MSDYEELQIWLDKEAENYIPTEEILKERGLTFKEAVESADRYRRNFFDLLQKYGICQNNISMMIAQLYNIISERQNDELLSLYTVLATEKCLLFGDIEDDEQKVLCWLKHSEKSEKFYKAVRTEKNYEMRLKQLSGFSENDGLKETDAEEQFILYQIALQYDFLYKSRKNTFFMENIGELVRKVNSCEELRVIKPYVYSAVLCRKHKLITERKSYSPNFANIFEKTNYRINSDNGKNFDTYKSYVELYEQLRRQYQDECDIDFSDYCFSHLSNLSEWYYENCEPNEEIPMTPELMTKYLIASIPLKELENITKKQPVLEISYHNILLNETEWLDMIHEVQDGADISDYRERLYNMAGGAKICRDRKLALKYAELYLCIFMENINRRILQDCVTYFL